MPGFDFYNKVNIKYFPKLLVAIPFTPIRSCKFLTKSNVANGKEKSIKAIKSLLNKYDISSAYQFHRRPGNRYFTR